MAAADSVINHVIHNDLTYEGVVLLTYRIDYPEYCAARFRMCLTGINAFYRNMALAYRRYLETALYSMAVEQYRDDMEHGYPVRVFEAVQTCETPLFSGCALSVRFDRYEYTGGAHGRTVRTSQTWDMDACRRVKLGYLVCCLPDCRTYILSRVEEQIGEDPELYFENYRELIAQTFNPNSFYCTPEEIVVYYQQYDIAPYSSGIREFLIPYSECVMDPRDLCRGG